MAGFRIKLESLHERLAEKYQRDRGENGKQQPGHPGGQIGSQPCHQAGQQAGNPQEHEVERAGRDHFTRQQHQSEDHPHPPDQHLVGVCLTELLCHNVCHNAGQGAAPGLLVKMQAAKDARHP